jgi:hypothetical protein
MDMRELRIAGAALALGLVAPALLGTTAMAAAPATSGATVTLEQSSGSVVGADGIDIACSCGGGGDGPKAGGGDADADGDGGAGGTSGGGGSEDEIFPQ